MKICLLTGRCSEERLADVFWNNSLSTVEFTEELQRIKEGPEPPCEDDEDCSAAIYVEAPTPTRTPPTTCSTVYQGWASQPLSYDVLYENKDNEKFLRILEAIKSPDSIDEDAVYQIVHDENSVEDIYVAKNRASAEKHFQELFKKEDWIEQPVAPRREEMLGGRIYTAYAITYCGELRKQTIIRHIVIWCSEETCYSTTPDQRDRVLVKAETNVPESPPHSASAVAAVLSER